MKTSWFIWKLHGLDEKLHVLDKKLRDLDEKLHGLDEKHHGWILNKFNGKFHGWKGLDKKLYS